MVYGALRGAYLLWSQSSKNEDVGFRLAAKGNPREPEEKQSSNKFNLLVFFINIIDLEFTWLFRNLRK